MKSTSYSILNLKIFNICVKVVLQYKENYTTKNRNSRKKKIYPVLSLQLQKAQALYGMGLMELKLKIFTICVGTVLQYIKKKYTIKNRSKRYKKYTKYEGCNHRKLKQHMDCSILFRN